MDQILCQVSHPMLAGTGWETWVYGPQDHSMVGAGMTNVASGTTVKSVQKEGIALLCSRGPPGGIWPADAACNA